MRNPVSFLRKKSASLLRKKPFSFLRKSKKKEIPVNNTNRTLNENRNLPVNQLEGSHGVDAPSRPSADNHPGGSGAPGTDSVPSNDGGNRPFYTSLINKGLTFRKQALALLSTILSTPWFLGPQQISPQRSRKAGPRAHSTYIRLFQVLQT